MITKIVNVNYTYIYWSLFCIYQDVRNVSFSESLRTYQMDDLNVIFTATIFLRTNSCSLFLIGGIIRKSNQNRKSFKAFKNYNKKSEITPILQQQLFLEGINFWNEKQKPFNAIRFNVISDITCI